MTLSLNRLRQTPQFDPRRFLQAFPGAWVQFYDDTAAKDPRKALSMRFFDLAIARQKQTERCAVCFSLQAFGDSRSAEQVTEFRTLGVDVDLVNPSERGLLSLQEIDRRKAAYLTYVLLPFSLTPHWLTETRHGFHAMFRTTPQRTPESIQAAMRLNRRLVSVLRGDLNAALVTQVFRVPGTLQFKDPRGPFLCRLLMDNSATLASYDLHKVCTVLEAWEAFRGPSTVPQDDPASPLVGSGSPKSDRWRDLAGVPEGQRNAAAARVVGGILGRLPEYLWFAGLGGLREWNRLNPVPLPDSEIRSVFLSIARREREKRRRNLLERSVAAPRGDTEPMSPRTQ